MPADFGSSIFWDKDMQTWVYMRGDRVSPLHVPMCCRAFNDSAGGPRKALEKAKADFQAPADTSVIKPPTHSVVPTRALCMSCDNEVKDIEREQAGVPYVGMPTDEPCEIQGCGKIEHNQMEPRFYYTVCRHHAHLTPVEVGRLRRQPS